MCIFHLIYLGLVYLIFATSCRFRVEWTCEDCARASNGLAIFSVNEEAIQAMVDVLIAELCPAAEDPTLCLEQLPGFWAEISRVIFPEHWKHICDDLEECEPAAKVCCRPYFFCSFKCSIGSSTELSRMCRTCECYHKCSFPGLCDRSICRAVPEQSNLWKLFPRQHWGLQAGFGWSSSCCSSSPGCSASRVAKCLLPGLGMWTMGSKHYTPYVTMNIHHMTHNINLGNILVFRNILLDMIFDQFLEEWNNRACQCHLKKP